ncbi:MAG TPA: hypothetical protein VLN59_16865 [Burkholderiales bacterium]|nr:hypothetical protein [Burkholderiales bacterium]
MYCQIYVVRMNGADFEWKWRLQNGERESSKSFNLFYDCVEDARQHGIEVDLNAVHGIAQPSPAPQ